ncbi:glycosyltransferase [Rhizobium sp. KVB221]|uniref:Glycosyltransferase n=1 Tax=Rhizobium setariae TaxID=2801340 RepID=A0A937CR73_9HYPH|nr:glycosyltransferase [Rhizobium setariae]MBL0374978.1 glycosyltransferase [Rhizobium setariae]
MNSLKPEILGHFEQIDNGLNVVGWAKNAGNDDPLNISVALNKTIVSSGLSNQSRPDLMANGIASGRAGFCVPIARRSIKRLTNLVHVLADGEIIDGDGRILNVARGMSIMLAGIEHGALKIVVRGWIGAAIKAAVKIDGVSVGFIKIPFVEGSTADGVEVALTWQVPEAYWDGRAHVYVVEIDHESEVVRSDAVALSYPDYTVFVEHADFGRIEGWAFRQDRGIPLRLDAYCDGMRLGSASTNLKRADVRQELGGVTANLGFVLHFDAELEGDCAEVTLIDAETKIEVARISISSTYEELAAIAQHRRTAMKSVTSLSSGMLSSDGATSFIARDLVFKDAPTEAGGTVSVVVPVYGGAVELAECMDSIFAAQNETKTEIILVNDNSPETVIVQYLRALELQGRENLKILHRKQNHGFSAAVNLGMVAAGSNDVILLNADTVVQDGWVDRIVAAAAKDSNIGTVTPFSSNGEICTLPYLCKSIPVETPEIAKAVDEMAARVNAGKILDIPVAIGFCMFIRRACLMDVGAFDAAKWGRGYGEEVDFCLKASSRGWKHVLAADVFLIHRGAVSFGDEKLQRIIESAKKINEAYPFYDRVIQRFLARDPVAKLRRDVNIGLLADAMEEKRVLHITHDLGGGTEKYVQDLAYLYRQEDYANLILRFALLGSSKLEIQSDQSKYGRFFQAAHNETYSAREIEELKNDIIEFGPEKIHIHSPIGVPQVLLSWLVENFDYDVTVHDFAWACPSVTFTTPSGRYFGETPDDKPSLAAVVDRPFPGLRHYLEAAGNDIQQYRKAFQAVMSGAKRTFAGSHDTVNRLVRLGFDGEFVVKPHPRTDAVGQAEVRRLSVPAQSDRIRVAIIGAISDIKGFPRLLECAQHAYCHGLPLQFIVFGYTRNDAAFSDLPNVEILGAYEPSSIGSLLARYQPHISFFPNLWPETFSYTLSLAFEAGLWPVVTDIGAPAERVRELQYGSVVPREADVAEICQLLIEATQQLQAAHEVEVPDEDMLDSYLRSNS